jgi:hypothetical protein
MGKAVLSFWLPCDQVNFLYPERSDVSTMRPATDPSQRSAGRREENDAWREKDELAALIVNGKADFEQLNKDIEARTAGRPLTEINLSQSVLRRAIGVISREQCHGSITLFGQDRRQPDAALLDSGQDDIRLRLLLTATGLHHWELENSATDLSAERELRKKVAKLVNLDSPFSMLSKKDMFLSEEFRHRPELRRIPAFLSTEHPAGRLV